jgi:hypothetical protein
MRNNASTGYGSRKAAAEMLEKSGKTSIMPSIAGAALSSTNPRGIMGPMGHAATATGALTALAMGHPYLAATLGGINVATNPRLAGNVVHTAGRMAPAAGWTARQATIGPPAAAMRYETQGQPAPAFKGGGYFRRRGA